MAPRRARTIRLKSAQVHRGRVPFSVSIEDICCVFPTLFVLVTIGRRLSWTTRGLRITHFLPTADIVIVVTIV